MPLVYVIPPYLLDSSLGEQLHRAVAALDPELADANRVSTALPRYRPSRLQQPAAAAPPAAGSRGRFAEDPVLHQIIKDKLIYKLATAGVAGDTFPMQKLADDEYLREMFEVFEDRLCPVLAPVVLAATDAGVSLFYGPGGAFADLCEGEGEGGGPALPEPVPESAVASDAESGDGELSPLLQADDAAWADSLGDFCLHNLEPYVAQVLRDNANDARPRYSMAQYSLYMAMPLRRLLRHARAERAALRGDAAAGGAPSFIEIGDRLWRYPLPVSWVPLAGTAYTQHLQQHLGLSIGVEDGYLVIRLSAGGGGGGSGDSAKHRDRYTNFVSDKAVPPSCGVFYYEVEVTQRHTPSLCRPLIVTNEEAISSNNAMHLSMGFAQRFLSVDHLGHPTLGAPLPQRREIDLERVKGNVDAFLQSTKRDKLAAGRAAEVYDDVAIVEDFENYLTAQPGVMRGSYAVSFEDSHFYNSERALESLHRTAVLNMNRRLSLNRHSAPEEDDGKVDLGFTLQTSLEGGGADDATYRTEVVGCGINFCDKSIFYTSNGVLVKVLPQHELTLSNALRGGLFFDAARDLGRAADEAKLQGLQVSDLKSVYPIIGIKLNTDLNVFSQGWGVRDAAASAGLSRTEIVTNMGFKEFKFNITNYMRPFREAAQATINRLIVEKLESYLQRPYDGRLALEATEEALLTGDQSGVIKQLIMGYLNHEGYLKLLGAFERDLSNLDREVGESGAGSAGSAALAKSEASTRRLVTDHIRAGRFDAALETMATHYHDLLTRGDGAAAAPLTSPPTSIAFELKFFKLLHMVKTYLDDGGLGATSTSPAFVAVFNYNRDLRAQYPRHHARIETICSLFLANDERSLRHLPAARDYLTRYDALAHELADNVNKAILRHLGFKTQSSLEDIIHSVDRNVSVLLLRYCDDRFRLVNFERDYLDL
jgi:hypothetical protein